MIKVLLADDVQILRAGLCTVLESDSDIKVVGQASDGKEAYEMSIRQIKDTLPDVKVLVLTTFDDKETVDKAIASGADGYILKEMDNDKIISSIKAVAGGINVFCDNIFKSIKKDVYMQQDAKNYDLTDREIDLLRLICEGADNKEIASKLYLAEGTVRNGISKLLEKLGLKDRTQLAVFAIKNNIL